MSKESLCPNYVGVTCVNGSCPIALYSDFPEYFDSKPNCKECAFYKGCSDCTFASVNGKCDIDGVLTRFAQPLDKKS